MASTTKERLLQAGLDMLLRNGYNDLGIQALMQATGTPKGSFYHHFHSKEEFALQVVDTYMAEVHQALDLSLGDPTLPPLLRVRKFFELTAEKYSGDGFLGCMLGGLGQELAGVSPVFQAKIEACFSAIADRLACCFVEAKAEGSLSDQADPEALANLVINCWEGAALRSRLRRDPSPLQSMLDFYFSAVGGARPN